MSQYKPRIVEEDTRSAWEKRRTGIHGHFAELEEAKHEREEETAPNPTVAYGDWKREVVIVPRTAPHLKSTVSQERVSRKRKR